ncbi:MAG: HutP family protein, partial [Acidaminococcaceae bacterium]
MEKKHSSLEVGRAALKIAITESREEEQRVKEILAAKDIHSTAVDFGGDFIQSIVKIVERAVVAAERQNLVADTHLGAGAVAGAAQEAL